jgi:hypothetical protein
MKQAPVLSDQDMKRMLRRCGPGGVDPRNRCIMMLSWLGGMRVRYPDQLRRPRWRPSQSCTNIHHGLLVGGR